MSDALPDLPSEVAVMVTAPPFSAVTSPVAFTDATVTSELVHTIDRPVSTLPLASFRVAVACVDWPAMSVGAFSATTTDATGATSAFDDEAADTATGTIVLRPSAIAVMSALPEAIVVTRPLELTVATSEFELLQEMLRPWIALPFTSYVV